MVLSKVKHKSGSKPVCWWCKIRIPLETPYRGEAPELGLPPGAGVVVCTPACPERPEDATVWMVAQWRVPSM